MFMMLFKAKIETLIRRFHSLKLITKKHRTTVAAIDSMFSGFLII